MALPLSFARDGFFPVKASTETKGLKRLMLGTEGWSDTGKTEFAMSAPGPGIIICLDRGLEWADNPHPPATRNPDFAVKIIPRLMPTQAKQDKYVENWRLFYAELTKALENKDCRTVVIDTDSDSWELQRLADFGRTRGVMPLLYPDSNAARKAMWAKAWDSGKVIISTNRLEEEYKKELDASRKEVSMKTGRHVRQGWKDTNYLFGMQVRHLRNAQGEFGVEIIKCKSDGEVVGLTFWKEECNFRTLVNAVYPDVTDKQWGF